MHRKLVTLGLIIACGTLLAASYLSTSPASAQVDTPEESIVQWEYREHVDRATLFGEELLLNKLGAEGWELVTAFPSTDGPGGSLISVYYFKRPKR